MTVGHWDPETSKRIFRELRLVDDSLPEGFTLEPWKPCDLSSWRGTFPGPIGTPCEGGAFEVNVQLPEMYRVVPPRVTFFDESLAPERVLHERLDVLVHDGMVRGLDAAQDASLRVRALGRRRAG